MRPNAASGDVGIAFAQVNSLEIGPCWDLWISIYEGTIAFRAVEAELNEALSNLATSAELTWEDGRWKVGVGDWQLQYITILTLQAELLQKKLSLDVLATWYHSNNCDQTPFGPPNGWDGNISGGTQIQLVCWQENDWEISYDGGLTWEPLGMPVTVCEYRPAMS